MRTWLVGLAAVTLAAGCRDKRDAAASAPAPAPTRVDATPAPPARPIAELFPAGAPALPPQLGDVTLTETALADVDARFTGTFGGTPDGFRDVTVRMWNHGLRHEHLADTVNVVDVVVPSDAGAADALAAAWGPPLEAPDNSGTRIDGEERTSRYWFDPARGLRVKWTAQPDADWITYTRYTPFEVIVGKPGAPFGIEGDAPLLGRSFRELRKAWGARVVSQRGGSNAQLDVPGAELDTFDLPVVMRLSGGKVTSWVAHLYYGRGPGDRKQAWVDALTAKLGAPSKHARGKQISLRFPTDPPIELLDQAPASRWDLVVGVADD